jgi:c-di-GMP-binding flagellar brake protein YcgR
MKYYFKSGLPLALGSQVTTTLRGEQYRVAVRGWRENQYIIVDNPSFHGEAIKIAPQTGCAVNYTLDGVFINFKTAVLHSFSQAVSLMILEFPKKFDKHNLRKNQRQKANFPIRYGLGESMELNNAATLRDISMTGGLVCSAHMIEKGHKITISLQLPQGDMTGMMAEVRNVRKNPKNEHEPFVIGIQFLQLNEEHSRVLREFMESRVSERRTGKR